MAAFSTKGLTVWIQKRGAGVTPTPPVTVTAITRARPAVVSVNALAIDGFVQGDVVQVAGTGTDTLDGRTFTVANVDDVLNTFELSGSDTSAVVQALVAGNVTNVANDLTEFCVASLDRQQQPAQAITVGTTCDPSAQIAGDPQAGTLSVTGFVDYTKAGFTEFMKAVDDGLPRVLEIRLPVTAVASGDGKIIFPSVTATGFSETFAVGAAASWTGEFTLGTKPIYYVNGTAP